MSVALLNEAEAAPVAYPPEPATTLTDPHNDQTDDLRSLALAQFPINVVWARIEAWIAWRWTPREVVWTLEGPGDWAPPLRPATIDGAEIWRGDAWEATELRAGPLGYVLEPAVYRITATVGAEAGDPPAEVQEAADRLRRYFAETWIDSAGVTRSQAGDYATEAPANHAAKAIHYSGAADLLRRYRR